MKNVLVTGGSGFIGTFVCECLSALSITPTVFNWVDPACGARFDGHYACGDIRNRDLVFYQVSQVEGVIHLAGLLGTQESIDVSSSFNDINVQGTLNVLDACRKYRVPCVDVGVGNHWMLNPYSISKTMAERYAFMYQKEFDLNVKVVRGFVAFGPGQKSYPIRKVVPSFVERALANDPIEIYGDGSQIMDLIWVGDLANILVRALLEENKIDFVIEAGRGQDTTINELAELIIKLSKSSSKIKHLPMRPGELPNAIVKANVSTLLALNVNVSDFLSLEEGLRRTIEWWRQKKIL